MRIQHHRFLLASPVLGDGYFLEKFFYFNEFQHVPYVCLWQQPQVLSEGMMLPSTILLAVGCSVGLGAAGSGASPGLAPLGCPSRVIHQCHQLFADTGLLRRTWSWVIHQAIDLFGFFPGCYLLWLFSFLSFTFQHFPFVPCVYPVPMSPVLQLVVTEGTQRDVPAHKCLFSCCCSSGDKCQPKG